MMLRRIPLSLVAVAMLLTAGVGLATLAARSVFRTASTEVSSESPAATSAARVGPEAGAVAPSFVMPAYARGEVIRLDAFRGHPVVLNFWASWCPPCREETRILEAAYLKYGSRGLVIIGVDSQSDAAGDSLAFLRQRGATYPAGRDERGVVARAYRVSALPTTYFIGADGRLQGPAVTGGFTGEDGARDLAAGIEKMLQ